MTEYWFEAWMSKYQVKDASSLERAVRNPKALDRLMEMAVAAFNRSETLHGDFIVAGKGIDLTNDLGCRAVECLTREVDSLFRHVWHYFDAIVLPDQAISPVLAYGRGMNIERLIESLSHTVAVVQLIRASGGRELIRFRHRLPRGRPNDSSTTPPASLGGAEVDLEGVIENIAMVASINCTVRVPETEEHPHLDYWIAHPWLDHAEVGSVCLVDEPVPESSLALKRRAAQEMVNGYWAALQSDRSTAHDLNMTLGATTPMYRHFVPTDMEGNSIGDVAFELNLPIASGWTVKDLISFRMQERDSFQRFQHALRLAIAERLKSSSGTPTSLGIEIQRDIIDPELRNIRDRLKASRRLSLQTAATGLALGTATAGIGLLSPLQTLPIGPGIVVGGAITLGASALKKAVDDYLSNRRDVSLSQMFFLWKAHKH